MSPLTLPPLPGEGRGAECRKTCGDDSGPPALPFHAVVFFYLQIMSETDTRTNNQIQYRAVKCMI